MAWARSTALPGGASQSAIDFDCTIARDPQNALPLN